MNLKTELSRKILHLCSSIIGISILLIDKSIYLPVLFIITILVVSFDCLRINFKNVAKIHNAIFSIFTRTNEEKQITGASFLLIGSSIVALFFNKEIAAVGLLIMSVSDSFAALVGIIFGKTKLFNKTLEGSTAFFVTTFTILIIFDYNVLESTFISFIATVTELFSNYRYNDNILIPLLTCSTIYIVNII